MNKSRVEYIDGIRGMAAMIVVSYHYLLSFFPALFIFKPEYTHTDSHIGEAIALSPLNILYNPGFAVCLFFVVSGYALSYKYVTTKNTEYLRASAIKRYFRLEIPILFSVVVSYILLKTEMYTNLYTANTYTKNTFWFAHLWNMSPDFLTMLKEGIYSSIFSGGTLSYNPVLWTMFIEFLGSMLVFAVLALFGNFPKRFLVYGILAIILHMEYIPAFIIGLALCDYYHSGQRKTPSKILITVAFLLAIYVGSYQGFETVNMWNPIGFISHADRSFPFIIGAALFVFTVINTSWLKKFFSLPLLQFLGKISFSIYLLHLLIIGSLSCSVFSYLYGGVHLSYRLSFIVMFSVSMAITLIASFLMYRYIDLSGIKLSKWIYSQFFLSKSVVKDE